MGKIQIGSAIAEPGQRGNGYLDVATYMDGSPVRIPVIILNGAKPGPKLLIQGCIHGNEFCGALGILQVSRELKPQEMAGALIGLPAINITAFIEEKRYSPFNYWGAADLNRAFPGRENGNFNEIMAYNILKVVIKNADYFIDCHTGNHPDTRWAICDDDGTETGTKSCQLAQAFGFDLVYPCNPETFKGELSGIKNALFHHTTKHKIPSIIVEAGGSGELVTSEAVSALSEGIKNVMKYLTILDEPFSIKGEYTAIKDFSWIWAPYGGRFAPTIKVREKIKKGQIIGSIFSFFEEELTLKAPADGVVLALSKKPFVTAGDLVTEIGML
jgi:hypothetical protein